MGLLFKLFPLVLVAYGWVRAPASVRLAMKSVRHAPSAMRTSMKMATAQQALILEFLGTDRWPDDVTLFLQRNVQGGVSPELDAWGTPLQLTGVPFDPTLSSCGPDRQCGTDDDLAMRLIPKKKKNDRPDPGFE